MDSGQINSDTIGKTFRSISQRRRNGTLELTGDSASYQLTFHNGSVVEARNLEEPSAAQICKRLVVAKKLSDKILEALAEVEITAEQLHSFIVGGNHTSHENFMRAKMSYELDVLHSLRFFEEGYYSFSPQIITFNSNITVALPPGHLLLDFVDMSNNQDKFERIFGAVFSDEVFIKRIGEPVEILTPEERSVFVLLKAETSLKKLAELSLISEFELHEALLYLYDQRLLKIRKKGELPTEKDLQASINDLSKSNRQEDFDNLVDENVLDTITDSIILSDFDKERVDSPYDTIINEAARFLEEIEVEKDESKVNKPIQEVAKPSVGVTTQSQITKVNSNLTEESQSIETSVVTENIKDNPKSSLLFTNYELYDSEAEKNFSTIVMLVILLVLTFIVPKVLGTWFIAVNNFTF